MEQGQTASTMAVAGSPDIVECYSLRWLSATVRQKSALRERTLATRNILLLYVRQRNWRLKFKVETLTKLHQHPCGILN